MSTEPRQPNMSQLHRQRERSKALGPIAAVVFVVGMTWVYGTALHMYDPPWGEVVEMDPPRALQRLLARGISPNSSGPTGRTWLHIAAGSEDPTKVRMLLTYGANPNVADDHGRTPLHVAAYCSTVLTCRLLLQAGANPRALDDRSRTPLDYARKRDNQQVIRLLAAYAPKQQRDRPPSTLR